MWDTLFYFPWLLNPLYAVKVMKWRHYSIKLNNWKWVKTHFLVGLFFGGHVLVLSRSLKVCDEANKSGSCASATQKLQDVLGCNTTAAANKVVCGHKKIENKCIKWFLGMFHDIFHLPISKWQTVGTVLAHNIWTGSTY